MNVRSRKYQKAVEYLYNIGMKVQWRMRSSENKTWMAAQRPSFLWDMVDYRIDPEELKHEVKFAKCILTAHKGK